MEGIFNILKSEGIEVPEESQKELTKKISSEYKSIAEYNNVKKKVENLQTRINELSSLEDKINELNGDREKFKKMYEDSRMYEYKLDTLKSGVNDKFVDFVTSETLKNVNEETDYKKALKLFLKENKQYLNNVPTMNVSTTPEIQNRSDNLSVNEIMNKFIRGKLT